MEVDQSHWTTSILKPMAQLTFQAKEPLTVLVCLRCYFVVAAVFVICSHININDVALLFFVTCLFLIVI